MMLAARLYISRQLASMYVLKCNSPFVEKIWCIKRMRIVTHDVTIELMVRWNDDVKKRLSQGSVWGMHGFTKLHLISSGWSWVLTTCCILCFEALICGGWVIIEIITKFDRLWLIRLGLCADHAKSDALDDDDDNHDGLDAIKVLEFHWNWRESSLNWPYVGGISDVWEGDIPVWALYWYYWTGQISTRSLN